MWMRHTHIWGMILIFCILLSTILCVDVSCSVCVSMFVFVQYKLELTYRQPSFAPAAVEDLQHLSYVLRPSTNWIKEPLFLWVPLNGWIPVIWFGTSGMFPNDQLRIIEWP